MHAGAQFLRAYDGHVSLRNRYTQEYTDIKCDLQVFDESFE